MSSCPCSNTSRDDWFYIDANMHNKSWLI